ncbi:hypothetical protein [Marinifilum fragile]|uniref:hypothetical protein n=1 Tax=Marinifilum fragile TaxID=570161 RepID=UPI002AA62E9C|nr:hypothetical protein [Marinifilum fragile]
MDNNNNLKVKELDFSELCDINGGGPIWDAMCTYYHTVGSFARGVYDGIMGNEPAV